MKNRSTMDPEYQDGSTRSEHGSDGPETGCRVRDGEEESINYLQWAIKLFRSWLKSSNLPTGFENYSPTELNEILSQFYVVAKTKHGESYHAETLVDIRNGLFKYLSCLNNTWRTAIQETFIFLSSNELLENMKSSVKQSKPKPLIKIRMSDEDLRKLMNSGLLTNDNPLGLFRKVWFDLAIHLGIGGQAAMRGLTADSFVTETDDKGRRYYRLNHNIKVQRPRSCMEMQYWNWEGRMYELQNDPFCPVRSLDLFLQKRNPTKDAFFQRPKSHFYTNDKIWYESPVGHSVLACLMSRMSEESGLSRGYTNSSVRVTVAELVDSSGNDIEEILGNNPRNKSLKGTPIREVPLTSDELRKNSNLIHQLVYNHIDTNTL